MLKGWFLKAILEEKRDNVGIFPTWLTTHPHLGILASFYLILLAHSSTEITWKWGEPPSRFLLLKNSQIILFFFND